MQQGNRFLDFAKELIGRYNDPGAYYEEALMVYPEEEQRLEEPAGEAVTYITNLYHTQNFNEENKMFVQNQSMLTQILEQNFYQNVYPEITEQIAQTVKEELPEAEERIIRSFSERYLTLRQKEQTEQIQNVCKQMFTEYHKNTTNVQKEQNTLLWKLENIYNSSIYALSAAKLTQREQQMIERKVQQLQMKPAAVEFQKILQEQPPQQVPKVSESGYEPVRLTYEEEQKLSEEAEAKKTSEQVRLSENNADKKTEDKQLQESAKKLTEEILHRTESFVQSAKEASVETIQQNQKALQLSEQKSSEQRISEQQVSETLPTVTKITEQEVIQVPKLTVPEIAQVPKVSESGYEPVRLTYEEEQEPSEEAEAKKTSEQVRLSENNTDKKTEDKQLQESAKELTREILHRTESFVQSAKEASVETIQKNQKALQLSEQKSSEQRISEQQVSEILPTVTKITEQEVIQVPKMTVPEIAQVPKVSESGYEPVRLTYEEEQKLSEEAEVKKTSEQVRRSENNTDKKTEDKQLQESAKELTQEILHRTESFVQSAKEVSVETIQKNQKALQLSEQKSSEQRISEQQVSETLPTVTKITEQEVIQVPKMTVPEIVQVPKVSESGYEPVRLTYEEEQKLSEEAETRNISEQVSLLEKDADKKTEDKQLQESAKELTREILHRTESFVQFTKEKSAELTENNQTVLQRFEQKFTEQQVSETLPTVTKITEQEAVQIPKVTVPENIQIPKVTEGGYEPVRLTYEEEQKLSEKSIETAQPHTLQQFIERQTEEASPAVTKVTTAEQLQIPKVSETGYEPVRLTYEEEKDTESFEQSKKEFVVTQAEREQRAKAAAEAQLQESAKKLTKEILGRTEFIPGAVMEAQQLNYMNQQMKLMYPAETWRVLKGTQSFQSEIAHRYITSVAGNKAGKVKLQPLGMEPAAIVYSQEEASADKEQTSKLQKQVEEVVRELKTVEKKTVIQSSKIVEQQKQVVREVLKSQPDILDQAQATKKLQKQIQKTVETQVDESITQIANRVYRQIEDRLKVERGRRGLF